MHALWAWQAEHCPSCHQHRKQWLDAHGNEIPDPPFVIETTTCPACGDMEQWDEENPKSKRKPGEKPYFQRVD